MNSSTVMERIFDSIKGELNSPDAENAASFSENNKINDHTRLSSVTVTVSENGLEAAIRAEAAGGSGSYSVTELEQAVRDSGVCFGVKPAVLMDMAVNGICGRSVVFASGIPAENGTDGRLTELYENTGAAVVVAEGAALCEITPPTSGRSGRDVYGKTICAKAGRSYRLPIGSNTRVSDDGTRLFAAASGVLTVEKGKYCVRDEYVTDEVKKGEKIEFFGDVTVRGGVCEGAEIRCGKTLSVGGEVTGARLSAARLIISGSCAESELSAESMELGDCEDCTLDAAVLLKCGRLANCGTLCDGELFCGEICGGKTDCAGRISCKRAGTSEKLTTEIILGNAARLKKDAEKLNARLEQAASDIEKIRAKQSEIPEKAEAELLRIYERRSAEQKRLAERLEQTEAAISAAADSTLRVSERLFAGVTIAHGEFRRSVDSARGSATVYANHLGVVIS